LVNNMSSYGQHDLLYGFATPYFQNLTMHQCPFAKSWWYWLKWSLCYISPRGKWTSKHFS
jgi:hypothetical protein